jgi:hypothetical protein
MSPSKFIKGWETCLVGLMNIYIFHYFVIKFFYHLAIRFITIMKIYFFYYEVLLGQSKTINELSDFHQKRKRKNEKTKKSPKNIKSFPPHPPKSGQH